MLDLGEIHEGLAVCHAQHGLGKITVLGALHGRLSVEFESGVYWGGVPIEQAARELDDPEAVEKLRRRMEAERMRDPLRWRINEQLNVLLDNQIATATSIQPGAPDENDTNLAMEWRNGWPDATNSVEAMMLSARMAERAVAAYYEGCGHSVEDVALQQLTNPSERDWKRYDIRVGNKCLDVKNARRSEQNRNSYVSHCVPRFKLDRFGKEIQIAGALSDWKTRAEIVAGGSLVRFLGTVTASRIDELRGMLAQGPLGFSVRSVHSPSFLPSWIFDYSAEDYGAWPKALEELGQCCHSTDLKASHLETISLPALIAAGVQDFDAHLPANSWQRLFAETLRQRHQQYGRSLPVLFLTLLEHFVGMLSGNAPDCYEPACYSHLIFPPKGKSIYPLYLFDPEHAVASLIKSLSTLWLHRNEALREIQYFTLRELNILSGKKKEDSPYLTLLAYCGGWIESGGTSKPCGKIPLVYGECDSCRECFRLVCPNCGFCRSDCTERAKLQDSNCQDVIDF
jgi:hypothetical protein